MVKLKVLKSFFDKEKKVTYQVGETIEVSEKRAKEILSHHLELAELIETVELDVEEVPQQSKKKKKSE